MDEQQDYLYVEAINLGNVVEDTADLSTRRAGGYLLLALIRQIRDHAEADLKAVSTGASRGLFELRPGKSLKDARKKVYEVLNRGLYGQATVQVVDSSDLRKLGVSKGDFVNEREHLLALVRTQQMSSLGLQADFGLDDGIDKQMLALDIVADRRPRDQQPICAIDTLRPAVLTLYDKSGRDGAGNQKLISVSRSVAWRRTEGIALRQSFYRAELSELPGQADLWSQDCFTDDFQQLSTYTDTESRTLPANLNGKVAIFYADGNKFSRHASECATPEDLTRFDETVQAARRQFLGALLSWIESHPNGHASRKQKDASAFSAPLRVETLMWGGDEFRLVLPAWLALEAVHLFFSTCKIVWKAQQLTHAVGLVFAHCNAPIAPLERLATDLAGVGKGGQYAGQDSLNWMVLESFDHAGGQLPTYWRRRGMVNLCWDDMTLNSFRLNNLIDTATGLKRFLPRSSLYAIVRMLKDWPTPSTMSEAEADNRMRLLQRAYDNIGRSVTPDYIRQWQDLWKTLQPADDLHWPNGGADMKPKPAHLNAWLCLVELWDYLPDTNAVALDSPIEVSEVTR